MQPVIIGDATLYCGDCYDVFPLVASVDHIITDPPYSERCHAVHDSIMSGNLARDGANRSVLDFGFLSPFDVRRLANYFDETCRGWIVWMTDSDLALIVRTALAEAGRTTFAPLPFVSPGSRVRLAGDGPSSWTDWICVARTPKQARWGTLPGSYIFTKGDKEMIGGKPTALMEALVGDYSRPGETVFDPFMGTGTTGVAALRLGRKFIGCEVDSARFEAACKRVENAQRQLPLIPHTIMEKREQMTL